MSFLRDSTYVEPILEFAAGMSRAGAEDVTSTRGAWRYAGAQFLLPSVLGFPFGLCVEKIVYTSRFVRVILAQGPC